MSEAQKPVVQFFRNNDWVITGRPSRSKHFNTCEHRLIVRRVLETRLLPLQRVAHLISLAKFLISEARAHVNPRDTSAVGHE